MKTLLAALFLGFVASAAMAGGLESNYSPPPCQGHFDDVACPSIYASWIEQLHKEGITSGCDGSNYCPGDPLTREQAAVFILRAEHRRQILTGATSCTNSGSGPNWAICSSTVTDPEIQEGMVIVGTYLTRVSDSQIPIRIFNIQNGSFSFEIQKGTSFMWLAAPMVPASN